MKNWLTFRKIEWKPRGISALIREGDVHTLSSACNFSNQKMWQKHTRFANIFRAAAFPLDLHCWFWQVHLLTEANNWTKSCTEADIKEADQRERAENGATPLTEEVNTTDTTAEMPTGINASTDTDQEQGVPQEDTDPGQEAGPGHASGTGTAITEGSGHCHHKDPGTREWESPSNRVKKTAATTAEKDDTGLTAKSVHAVEKAKDRVLEVLARRLEQDHLLKGIRRYKDVAYKFSEVNSGSVLHGVLSLVRENTFVEK